MNHYLKDNLVRTLFVDGPVQVYRVTNLLEDGYLEVVAADQNGDAHEGVYPEHIRPERVELYAFDKHKIGDKVFVAGEKGEWQIKGFMPVDHGIFAQVELISNPPRKWVPAKRLS